MGRVAWIKLFQHELSTLVALFLNGESMYVAQNFPILDTKNSQTSLAHWRTLQRVMSRTDSS